MYIHYHNINWNRYPIFFPLIFFCLGIIFYAIDYSKNHSLFDIIIYAFIAVMIVFVWLQFKQSLHDFVRIGRWLMIVFMFAFLGWMVSFFQDPRNIHHWIGNVNGSALAWKGSIQNPPAIKNKVVILDVEIDGYFDGKNWNSSTGKLAVLVFKNDTMKTYSAGNRIVLPNKISKITNSNNPFSFKQANYAALQDKYYQTFLPDDEILLMANNPVHTNWISNIHQNVQKIIYDNVNDTITAGLIAAIILNERANMDKALWEDYSRTGVAHIVAISGMHITLFFAIVGYLLFFIRHRKYQWIKYVIMIPIAWLYIALTGFPPSAVRAGIMFTLLSLANFKRREGFGINILFTTALIILLFNTKWLFDVGFQLSFLSVLSILIFYKPISSWVKFDIKVLKWIWNTIAVSIAVQILLTPVIMYYFNQFPLFSIIANVPAALYSALFMGGSLLIIILGSLGINVSFIGDVLEELTRIFNQIIQQFSNWSPEGFFRLHITPLELIFISFATIIISYSILLKNRKVIKWLIPVIICLMSTLIFETIQRNKQAHLVVYQINGKSLIENVNGRTSTVYHSPDFEEADKKFTVKNAQIGWGTKSVNTELIGMNLFRHKDKNVLILTHSEPIDWSQKKYSIDYLILTQSAFFDPVNWKEGLTPKLIIIDGSVPRYKARQYIQELDELGLAYHWVLEGGAFVD